MDLPQIRKLRRASKNAYAKWREMNNEALAEYLECSEWAAGQLGQGRVPASLTPEQIAKGQRWVAKRSKHWDTYRAGTLRAIGNMIGKSQDGVASMLKERKPSTPCAAEDDSSKSTLEFLTMRLTNNPCGVVGYY